MRRKHLGCAGEPNTWCLRSFYLVVIGLVGGSVSTFVTPLYSLCPADANFSIVRNPDAIPLVHLRCVLQDATAVVASSSCIMHSVVRSGATVASGTVVELTVVEANANLGEASIISNCVIPVCERV